MKKDTLYLVAIIAVAAIALLGWSGSLRSFNVPQTHKDIVGHIEIIERQNGESFSLTPICVDAGLREFSKDWPELSLFNIGEEYYQSTWLWQRHGDTEACLTIWGPAEDGKGYDCEASRLVGFQQIDIWYNGERIRTMRKVQASELYECMPGFVWFEIVLE